MYVNLEESDLATFLDRVDQLDMDKYDLQDLTPQYSDVTIQARLQKNKGTSKFG